MPLKTFRIFCMGFIASLAFQTLSPLSAHHANSAYDREQIVKLKGTVTKWQFINPHAGLWINVIDAQGNTQEWSGEFQSVQDLYRFFEWNKDTFRVGDLITITGNPDRRPDTYSIWTSTVIFQNGTKIDVRNTPE